MRSRARTVTGACALVLVAYPLTHLLLVRLCPSPARSEPLPDRLDQRRRLDIHRHRGLLLEMKWGLILPHRLSPAHRPILVDSCQKKPPPANDNGRQGPLNFRTDSCAECHREKTQHSH